MDRRLVKLYLKLIKTPGLGPVRIKRIYSRFGTLSCFLEQPYSKSAEFLNPILLKELKENINTELAEYDRIIDRVLKLNGDIITIEDDIYPDILKQINAPPPLLYTLGNIQLLNDNHIAVVGTREPSENGRISTSKIVQNLVENNLTIVSGFARGIDTIAHKTTLENGGKTIAVFGNGIDIIYPYQNKELYNKIISNGLILSEFEPEVKPSRHNFPRRNRIISGLSQAVVIIEGSMKSGALITANFAIQDNRTLFALPGPIIEKRSEGPNRLIELGAIPITSVDIIPHYLDKSSPKIEKEIPRHTKPKAEKTKTEPPKKPNPEIEKNEFEKKILSFMQEEAIHIDALAEIVECPVQEISSLLFVMELKGLVKSNPGMYFIAI